MLVAEIVIAAVVALLVVITVMRSVRIVPQARARNVERLGRYRKTLEPGLNFVLPMIDRVKPILRSLLAGPAVGSTPGLPQAR